jgi:taurine transport system permease protein
VLVGWIVAVILGVGLGFAFAWSPVIRDYADPLFQLIRPIPPIAWIPFALLWFGISPNARIFVVAIAAFAPCVINTYEALRGVDRSVMFAARTAGASKARTMLEIAFPSALPKIVVGIQIALGSAWMTLVAAELLAAQSGVGYMMQIARTSFQADVILVGMVLVGAIGMLMSALLRLAVDRAIVWEKRA